MMLIIQTGDPLPLAQPYGRFSDWFIDALGIKGEQVQVVDVHHQHPLPECNGEGLTGVVITGSAAMVTEQADWMVNTQRWLEQVMAQQIPVLGVCFGHQLLADMLGGQVAHNQRGRHMGLARVQLAVPAADDDLLDGCDQQFDVLVSHQQVVTQAPQSATILAKTAMDPNHAFRWQDRVWGLQFHPEWSPQVMRAYIDERASVLAQEGMNPEQMKQQLKTCDQARGLLRQFAGLCQAGKVKA
jgi:GMP synthase (glutamine-hydrolysing)